MSGPKDLSSVPRIGIEEAKALFDAAGAVFVDVRSTEAYDQSHIPGAVSMLLARMPIEQPRLPRDKLLVLY